MNKKEIVCYETDVSRLIGKARKVIFPTSIEQIKKIVKTSNLDIVPRGAGTGLFGGSIPKDSILVCMGKMNHVINFNRTDNLVYVEAGISIKELNERLEAVGFEFPIQPLNKAATIGGMIAVNAFDGRSMKYGRVKNWIEEIEFVDGKGELSKTGKADLTEVCGMEGITGIIVRVKLKVIPKINRSISIFQTNSLKEALLISRRLKTERDTIMIELLSKYVSRLLGLPEKYNLIIEFDSDRGKIKDEEYEKIIELKEKVYSVLVKEGYYAPEDYKFFFDKLKDFILYLEGNQVPYFSYLGSGIIYVFFKEDQEEKRKELIKLVKKAGGRIGGNGFGIKRKDFLDEFDKKIIRRIKSRHDPMGKLNRGKVIEFEGKININSKEEIKPTLGEEISASEIEVLKTPEKEMEEFIEKVEMIEKEGEQEAPGRLDEEKQEKREPLNETQELLKDYEYTYKSELPEERKEKIEDFARDVPKQIEKRGKLSKEDEDIVKRVMMGGDKDKDV